MILNLLFLSSSPGKTHCDTLDVDALLVHVQQPDGPRAAFVPETLLITPHHHPVEAAFDGLAWPHGGSATGRGILRFDAAARANDDAEVINAVIIDVQE